MNLSDILGFQQMNKSHSSKLFWKKIKHGSCLVRQLTLESSEMEGFWAWVEVRTLHSCLHAMPSVAAGEPEAMELPSYEDLGEATDLSAVEVAWRAWAAG